MNKQVVTLLDENKEQVIPVTKASVTYMDDGNSVEATIRSLKEDAKYKGYFKNEEALLKAFPNNILKPELRDGWYVSIGTTDTFWLWDSDDNRWEDSKSYTSPVTSVNGKTGEVILTGEDINSTPTIDDAGVTKPITQHLETIYSNINALEKQGEPIYLIGGLNADDTLNQYNIKFHDVPNELKGKNFQAFVRLNNLEKEYHSGWSISFEITWVDGTITKGVVTASNKGYPSLEQAIRGNFSFLEKNTYLAIFSMGYAAKNIHFTDINPSPQLLSTIIEENKWFSASAGFECTIFLDGIVSSTNVLGFNKINSDGSKTSAVIDYTITTSSRDTIISLSSDKKIKVEMLYAIR